MPSTAHSLSPTGRATIGRAMGTAGGRPRPFDPRRSGRRGLEPAERHGIGREQHVDRGAAGFENRPRSSPATIHCCIAAANSCASAALSHSVESTTAASRRRTTRGRPRRPSRRSPPGPRIRPAAGRAPARATPRRRHHVEVLPPLAELTDRSATSTGVGTSFGYRSGWMICSVDTGRSSNAASTASTPPRDSSAPMNRRPWSYDHACSGRRTAGCPRSTCPAAPPRSRPGPAPPA